MTETTPIPGQLWRGGLWSENGRLEWQCDELQFNSAHKLGFWSGKM